MWLFLTITDFIYLMIAGDVFIRARRETTALVGLKVIKFHLSVHESQIAISGYYAVRSAVFR